MSYMKPIARFPPRCKQGGFLLPQLAVALLVFTLFASYEGYRYTQKNVNQSRDDKAKLIGERMANVSDATKTYATTFFTQIQRGESVTRNGYSLAPQRLLAPTLTDLSGLGFLPASAINPMVYNGQTIQLNVAMRINTQSGCTIPTCSLLFQVTTSAPLLIPNGNTVDIRRATIAATAASPGNAGVSMPSSMGGDPSVFVGNGGTVTGTNSGGVAGLVSISNGYDSQGFFEFLRRDGSLPMTGTLNMQDAAGAKHDITNANDIGAVDVTASGDMTAAGAVLGKTVTSTARLKTGEFLQIDGVAVEGRACQARTMALDSGGLALTCQGGTWSRLRTYRFDVVKISAINDACANHGDPDNPPHYSTFTYQVTCAVRYCINAYGYQFGLINEYGYGYNIEHPYYSDPNTIVNVACSR
jgi:hypothetical protein